MVGYAVACTADTTSAGESRPMRFSELLEVVRDAPRPAVVVVQHVGADRLKSCYFGDMSASGLHRVGVVGVVTDGAFNAFLTVRLDPGRSSEQVRIVDFVIIEGEEYLYFSLISDIQLRATDKSLLADPPRDASPFIRRALAGTSTYATVQIKPMLMIEKPQEGEMVDVLAAPQPVRTIPMHFATLRQATHGDFRVVFGEEDKTHFSMGTRNPDLRRFTTASGKAGRGIPYRARLPW